MQGPCQDLLEGKGAREVGKLGSNPGNWGLFPGAAGTGGVIQSVLRGPMADPVAVHAEQTCGPGLVVPCSLQGRRHELAFEFLELESFGGEVDPSIALSGGR